MERYTLAIERIQEIQAEEYGFIHSNTKDSIFSAYFSNLSDMILKVDTLKKEIDIGRYYELSLEDLQKIQEELYTDVLGKSYDTSIYSAEFLEKAYGMEYAKILSVLSYEMRGLIPLVYEQDEMEMAKMLELFIEFYLACKDKASISQLEEIIYWYVSDYLDESMPKNITYLYTDKNPFYHKILKNLKESQNYADLRYLFYFGEYISDTELKLAEFLSTLPEETIQKMADTLTEGYRMGFIAGRKDLSKKRYASLHYNLGFERMIIKSMENLENLGLSCILTRSQYRLGLRGTMRRSGVYSQSVNKQMDYDHRFDEYIYLDKAFIDRKLTLLRSSFESIKKEAGEYAGPVVVEEFGEKLFEPVNRESSPVLTEKQRKLKVNYTNAATLIQSEFIHMEERSFTIIAWPLPEIADSIELYHKIFNEVIRINTLDYKLYQDMQQILIDELDTAEYVVVKGGIGNETDIKVKLHILQNPSQETNFENCVADVNIPVGEVFTSPVLKGTEGLLHVGRVYIGDIKFLDLKLWFKDGMVKDYICSNFETVEENKKLIEDILLKNHPTLPLGEFAIGTNTVAYQVAKKYDIFEKLPILIAEKMGPHFAIGDTCYNMEEDVMTYNPDGKAIIARENEISALRKTDITKAYLNCHTDITIPYDELGDIYTVRKDKSQGMIIQDGKFVLAGVERLNVV